MARVLCTGYMRHFLPFPIPYPYSLDASPTWIYAPSPIPWSSSHSLCSLNPLSTPRAFNALKICAHSDHLIFILILYVLSTPHKVLCTGFIAGSSARDSFFSFSINARSIPLFCGTVRLRNSSSCTWRGPGFSNTSSQMTFQQMPRRKLQRTLRQMVQMKTPRNKP